MKLLAFLLALFLPALASAQTVQQSGNITPGHAVKWITGGVIGDAGTASAPGLNSLGIVASGTPSCINDAPITGPYHQLCFGANALGGGLISYQNMAGAIALPLNVNVNGQTYPLAFPLVNGMTTVATNVALKAVTVGTIQEVYRAGFYAAGDGGDAFYWFSSSACSLNSGAGDNGSQVAPNSGTGCWIAAFGGSAKINVKVFGAKGDGVTNDSTAAQNAINAAAALTGRSVVFPSTGHAYLFNTGLVVGNGSGTTNVSIEGTAGAYWPGYDDNTEADWTAFGTWFHCTDTVNACLSVSGNGGDIGGLNFWYTQTTPPGSNCGATCTFTHDWTPTTYPYTISIQSPQNFNHFHDINIINATNCIDLEGPNTGVGSFYTYFDHMQLGCFNTGMKFGKVDNAIAVNDVKFLVLWYQAFNDVWGYMEGDSTVTGHKVDVDMYYLSDANFNAVQFYQSWAAIRATDASVGSGLGTVTFAGQGLTWHGTVFNQVCQAIILAASTTHFNSDFADTVLNIDPQTSVISGQCGSNWPYAINVNSDNADVSFVNLNGFEAQSLANIGGGSSGGLHLSGRVRISYSAFGSGANAINVNTGGFLDMDHGVNNLFPVSGAGTQCSGACSNWPIVGSGALWTQGAAGTARQHNFVTTTTGGAFQTRWGVVADSTSESGANAGSNFGIFRYSDAGSFIDEPLSITRSTGVVTMNDGVIMVLPTSCSGKPTGTLWNNSNVLNICP